MSNLRWKIITIVSVFVVFFGIGVYPILAARYKLPAPQWLLDHQLKLGLDLKGGVHLVLRVQTDDALRVKTEQDSGRLQEELKRGGVPAAAAYACAKSISPRLSAPPETASPMLPNSASGANSAAASGRPAAFRRLRRGNAPGPARRPGGC